MSFKVHFVGLVCFVKHERIIRALMPDGTYEKDGVPLHAPFFCVANADIDTSGTSWPEDRQDTDDLMTLFWWFTPSQVNIEGADKLGALRTYDQDSRLPRLSLYPNQVRIDPNTAPAIADIPIRQGRLEAFRMPGSCDNGQSPLISQLDVPHDKSITVTVTPYDQTGPHRVKLFPATEIVFVNSSPDDLTNVLNRRVVTVLRGSFAAAVNTRSAHDRNAASARLLVNDNHYELYGTLADPPVHLGSPGPTPLGIPDSKSKHVFFESGTVGSTPRCSNTGCC